MVTSVASLTMTRWNHANCDRSAKGLVKGNVRVSSSHTGLLQLSSFLGHSSATISETVVLRFDKNETSGAQHFFYSTRSKSWVSALPSSVVSFAYPPCGIWDHTRGKDDRAGKGEVHVDNATGDSGDQDGSNPGVGKHCRCVSVNIRGGCSVRFAHADGKTWEVLTTGGRTALLVRFCGSVFLFKIDESGMEGWFAR